MNRLCYIWIRGLCYLEVVYFDGIFDNYKIVDYFMGID